MKAVSTLIFIGLMMFLPNAAVNAQPFWTQVPLPNIYYKIAPYFLNENVGFAFDLSLLRQQSNLRKTTDGGSTWQSLPFFNNINMLLEQIYFTDLNRGYAATDNGVYETQDGGNSWKSIYKSGTPISSVYAFGGKVFAFAGTSYHSEIWGPLISSDNDGASWDTIIQQTTYAIPVWPSEPMPPYVFGNKDGTVFAEDIINQQTMELLYSTNNGTDWIRTSMDVPNQTYTMGLFCFPHCNNLLRTYISFAQDPKSDVNQIVSSSDFGAHWNKLYFPIEMGAWIAGNNCVQYFSNAEETHETGIYRSMDKGKNWSYLNGPDFTEIDDEDFRNISVVGGGAVLYAGDYSPAQSRGKLWKTTSGGDGTLSPAQFAPQITMDHNLSSKVGDTLKMRACDTGLVTIPFQNISCNVAQFRSLSIDSLSASEFSTKVIHHLYCDGLPDTILISIAPASAGIRNVTVHPQFIDDEYESFDTSFTFILNATSGSGTIMFLKSPALSDIASDSIDIPLYLTNPSPTPIQLGLDSISLTYKLNTDILGPMTFQPTYPGITRDSIIMTASSATVTLYFASGFNFTGETMIGKLRCKAYVSDSFETDIACAANALSSPCSIVLSNAAIHFTIDTRCGDSALSNLMKYGSAFIINSIIPNPARNSITVNLKNNEGDLRYEVFDVLGVLRKSGKITASTMQIDLSELSPGNYYFRLSGGRGIPITKRVVIVK